MSRIAFAAGLVACASASPLWDYVHKPDANYAFYDTGIKLDNQTGWTGYLLNMTSQSWLTPADSNRYIWTHQLLVVIPWNYNSSHADTAALWITGGGNNNPSPPGKDDEDTLVCASLATSSGTVCAVLYQAPNQDIIFTADPLQKSRSEDAAVAFTWAQYMLNATDKPEWILYFPMVKAAVRAMDTVQAYAPSVTFNISAINKWMVFGASKRGWTTWLTGAVDSRIIGIAPVVMDLLNFKEGVMAMYQTIGGWTFAFTDYYEMNITKYLTTPTIDILAAVIDPINYKANLTMPKLIIDATGDEFFQVQDDSFWWGQLPGETLRMMVDNAEHSMATGALYLITGVEAWYQALITNTPRPTFSWSIDRNSNGTGTGAITIVATGSKPADVVLRFTTTVDGDVRRDFRLVSGNTPANPCKFIPLNLFGSACLKPIIWVGESVAPTSSGNATVEADDGSQLTVPSWTYVLTQPLPPVGWRGFLGELYYDGPDGTRFQLTTQVSVIPNTFPFPPCVGDGCISVLV